jgi:hypothetical protein
LKLFERIEELLDFFFGALVENASYEGNEIVIVFVKKGLFYMVNQGKTKLHEFVTMMLIKEK